MNNETLNEVERNVKILQTKIDKYKTDEDKKKIIQEMSSLKEDLEKYKDDECLNMTWWECLAYSVGETFPPAYLMLGVGFLFERRKGKTLRQFVSDRINTIGKMMDAMSAN